MAKRKTELARMQDRLLNAYLAGTIEESVYCGKSSEMKADSERIDNDLQRSAGSDRNASKTALQIFDWAQNAADFWIGSNNRVRREILAAVCLNRTLSDVNLETTKRKPFDVFAKGLDLKNSRGERI